MRVVSKYVSGVAVLLAAALLAGCGGDEAPGAPGSSGGAAATPTLTIALTDSQTGQSSNTVTLAAPLTATATALSANGTPQAGVLVQFQIQGAGSEQSAPAVLNPASGSGLTDASGRFSVTVSADGVSSQGAGTLQASATVQGATVSGTANFQVGASNFSLRAPTFSANPIDAFQTSTLTVLTNGLPSTVPVVVSFSSSCVAAGRATLPASVTTSAGVATATYTDNGCGQTDIITASATGAASVQGSLVVRAPQPTNIRFVSATPSTIGIAGTGAPSSSVVRFQIVDALQQGVANQSVSFALETSVGGVSLGTAGSTTATGSTDSQGFVNVNVLAGTQPGPVRVRATSAGLTTVSSELAIQSGLPTQNRLSLAVETFNIEGWNVDGVTTRVTASLADRVGNPVPNGTVVNFRSSGALVEPSCQTNNGSCSVTFRSQEARWASQLTQASGLRGRIQVLAYAVGEESFTDTNGNNRFDAGEPFVDLGDAFVDVNRDTVQQTDTSNAALNEEFIPFNAAATSACPASTDDAVPSRAGSCDGVWGAAHVRRITTVVLSSSSPGQLVFDPSALVITGPAAGGACSGFFKFELVDVNGNAMPAGTTITATGTGLTFTVSGSPVINTTNTGTSARIDVSGTCVAAGQPKNTVPVTIRITSPRGLTTAISYSVSL